ncbi:deoxynucleotidyltransferase terminal-interacting protein 1 [Anopheles aquasalis]|uniref:deoxynucleotidyltransferase terminal-interacting protein 1 n=1 Tax=Anopheles aquasalis TaxID=42839 RepID=UPI00215A2033|nr:deoxynucleotidyltransferase terminal-interacting protein 1 [Anopheles aquasalis]
MVIQRVWRSQGQASLGANTATNVASTTSGTTGATASPPVATSQPTAATSVSDALEHETSGNGSTSNHNNSTLGQGMRQKLYKNMLSGEATLDALKQRYSTGRSFMSQTANDAAIKSLELLRANIQYHFDREIDTIVRRFHQTYFVPAIRNIKENLGEGAISDEALKGVFCTLLESAKAQYGASQLSSPAGNSLSRANTPGMELSDSDSSTDNAPAVVGGGGGSGVGGLGVATSLLHQALKRKLPEPNQPDLFKRQYFLHGPIYPHVHASSSSTTTSTTNSSSTSFRTPSSTTVSVPATVITPESLFILDFKAARALGVPDFRERLANRHPEVLRYCPDAQDRDWLLQQRQVTPLNKNGRFFLLALDDVRKLIERNAFEPSASTGPQIGLQGFKVTELIYAKIQKLLKELTERHQRATAGTFESPKTPAITSSSAVSVPSRSRFSSLSSSHATLTALLSTPQSISSTPESTNGSSSSSSSSSNTATVLAGSSEANPESRRS